MIFPVRFMMSNILISLLLGFLFLLKWGLKKHLTMRAQYQLWYPFLAAMILPILPCNIIPTENIWYRIRGFFLNTVPESAVVSSTGKEGPHLLSNVTVQDFSTAVISSNARLTALLCGMWIIGMFTAGTVLFCTMVKIYRLRKQGYAVTEAGESALYSQFLDCRRSLCIKSNVKLYACGGIQSPISYGWLYPKILIPFDLDIRFSENEIRFIFLHELQHCRRRDPLLNYILCILQILYWFHPLTWYAFAKIRQDQEIACDNAVISFIGKDQGAEYGHTLLKYAEHIRRGRFLSPASAIGGSRNRIKQRILAIAEYHTDSVRQKAVSAGILLLTLLVVCCSSPLYTAYASADPIFRLQSENWEAMDLSAHFGGIKGSFVLYDMENDRYHIYNKELSQQRVSPDSTYKIYSSLFALEEQVISPGSTAQHWDGTLQPFEAWNQDHTLDTAMSHSVNWYFQSLDRQIGLLTLYQYYDRISYGNCDLTGGVDAFWAESSLKISPVEQVILLTGLLENRWDFHAENVRAVKESLFLADTPAGKLYGKTGTAESGGSGGNGWFVGFLKGNEKDYCFAANLQDSENATGRTAFEMTVDILLQHCVNSGE